jgi:hypothetical protein
MGGSANTRQMVWIPLAGGDYEHGSGSDLKPTTIYEYCSEESTGVDKKLVEICQRDDM